MQTFFTASILGAVLASASEPREWKLKVSMDQYTTHYFDNKINHFNEPDQRTYKQRYWFNDEFVVDKTNAPVFLYICGEWTCTPPDDHMFPMMVGAEHGAILYSLEHRYYGDSQPFDDWSTDNLEFLSSEQALADIAAFIDGQNETLGYKADWIVIGGSYPGALSAWFKSQYPEHAVGAWSSSGVIHAIKDFKSFDLDIFMRTDASDPACSNAVMQAIDAADRAFKTEEGTKEIAETFGITIPIDKRDFWFYFADIFVMGVQYGTRVSMCEKLEAATDAESLLETVAALGSGAGVSYDQYDAVSLSGTTIDISSSLRQWTYQYCTEFGFFQTPNVEQPMRHQSLRAPFWPDYCERVFGRPIRTGTAKTNEHYGGLEIEGDNIFFLNGSEDPWQYAAMRELPHPATTQKTMSVQYIQCDSCAHCVDFHTPADDQPQALTDAQNAVADEVARWLSEAQATRDANWADIETTVAAEEILEGDGTQIFLQA